MSPPTGALLESVKLPIYTRDLETRPGEESLAEDEAPDIMSLISVYKRGFRVSKLSG
jgi:hypothetical protein